MGRGGVKSPIHFHCALHAKKRWGGGVQIACKFAYVLYERPQIEMQRIDAESHAKPILPNYFKIVSLSMYFILYGFGICKGLITLCIVSLAFLIFLAFFIPFWIPTCWYAKLFA